jgi:hypothetical protein
MRGNSVTPRPPATIRTSVCRLVAAKPPGSPRRISRLDGRHQRLPPARQHRAPHRRELRPPTLHGEDALAGLAVARAA